MYTLIITNGEDKDKEIMDILSHKPVKVLKIIYETDTEKCIVLLDKEIIKKLNDFFDSPNLNINDKILIQMLLQTASVYQQIQTVYQIVSEELEISIRTIKLKLVKIKNILGYKCIHPDDFLKEMIGNIGVSEKNIKVFSA